ncbi:MAG: circularly permuted type 2 ATP-grasp protein [Pirellulales bacterium]
MSVITSTFKTLWDSYRCPPGVYDEVFAGQEQMRPHWQALRDGLHNFAPHEFARRTTEAEQLLHDNGVTFDVFRDQEQSQRPWRLDLIPLILNSYEWQTLQAGIDQRAWLLQLIIKDLHGPSRLLREGWLPPEVVYAQTSFQRPFFDLHAQQARSLVVYAAELARGDRGGWCVMADRSEAPVGAGFTLEHRIVTSRTIPQLMHRQSVRRMAPFFMRFQNTLKELAQRPSENPRIVLLSAGPQSPYYFEDVYLSGYLGYTLVQGADLAVRDERVYLKTLAGLMPVDVIYSRSQERGFDPLELGGNSPHGVPGILQAIRRGNVAVANVPGCGLVESPVFMAFLPGLCQRLLGEDLKLPSIPTWWCGELQARRYVLDNLRHLVIKPAFEASGSQEFIGSQLSDADAQQLAAKIEARPHAYVAQSMIARSAAPVFSENQLLECGHVAVRVFAVAHPRNHDHYELLPGGLVRVAPSADPMKLSVAAGAGSKDLWILADANEEPVTLLQSPDMAVPLRRSGAMFPSRVADDLFWLGWAIERVDFLARLVRALVERLTTESETEGVEWSALVRALADQGQLEPGFAIEGLADQLPALAELLPKTLFDTGEIRGLGHACAEMLRLGALVRDRLSPDTWAKIHATGARFLAQAGRNRPDLTEVLTRLNDLIVDQASVSGLIEDGMIRGPAWRFLDMGRRIERGRNAAGLLRTSVASGDIRQRPVLRLLLEILDCRMTYRSRYLDNLQPNAILDLFITDETNPRSVAFQAVALAEHVDSLPQDVMTPLRTDEKRWAMSVVHLVRTVTPEQLAASNLSEIEKLLTRTDQNFRHVMGALTLKYLVHSGVTRQITDESELPV